MYRHRHRRRHHTKSTFKLWSGIICLGIGAFLAFPLLGWLGVLGVSFVHEGASRVQSTSLSQPLVLLGFLLCVLGITLVCGHFYRGEKPLPLPVEVAVLWAVMSLVVAAAVAKVCLEDSEPRKQRLGIVVAVLGVLFSAFCWWNREKRELPAWEHQERGCDAPASSTDSADKAAETNSGDATMPRGK